jgi:hypothetical protein
MEENHCVVSDEHETPESGLSGAVYGAHGDIKTRTRAEGRRVVRTIPPEAGHALETLGHAIEYLTDEMNLSLLEGSGQSEIAGMAVAINRLKAANREVYFECPMVQPSAVRVGLEWLRFYRFY